MIQPSKIWRTALAALVILSLALAAPASAGSTVLVSLHDPAAGSDTLIALDPATGQARPLFNFAGHPRHKAGLILGPRVDASGKLIYFSSDNSFAYTPFRRNLFAITADGQAWQQITPGANSGRWDQPCPCGSVRGRVARKDGRPWSAAPVFLEGVGMAHTKPDGSFEFKRAPQGNRWIMAYRPGNTSAYDSQLLAVGPGAGLSVNLIPDRTNRPSLHSPVPFGDSVYFLAGLTTLVRFNPAKQTTANLYQVQGSCTLKRIGGFDLGPKTGRLAIVDYGEGCPTNRGLYVNRSNQLRLLVDAKADQRWCGLGQVFWSPDERRLALTACLSQGGFNRNTYLLIIDAASGRVTGTYGFADQKINLAKVRLNGWSPDGGYVLFSWYADQPAGGNLSAMRVNANGALDANSGRNLISGRYINGATWANLATGGQPKGN